MGGPAAEFGRSSTTWSAIGPTWAALEAAAVQVPPGSVGVPVIPVGAPEPSLGVAGPRVGWSPSQPAEMGVRFRASLEALAYLIALGVRARGAAMRGGEVDRVRVSGGIAKSDLMSAIL